MSAKSETFWLDPRWHETCSCLTAEAIEFDRDAQPECDACVGTGLRGGNREQEIEIRETDDLWEWRHPDGRWLPLIRNGSSVDIHTAARCAFAGVEVIGFTTTGRYQWRNADDVFLRVYLYTTPKAALCAALDAKENDRV